MSKYQSDEKISENLNKCIPNVIKDREQCISNSLIVESTNGSYIIYVARGKDQELLLVVIDLNVTKQINGVQFVPIVIKNSQIHILEGMRFQIASSPYQSDCYSFVAYDPKKERQNQKGRLVYFTAFPKEKMASLKQIELMNFSKGQHGRVKDVKWYPFSQYTLIVLTETKILTYNLITSLTDPVSEISLRDLKLSITNQNIRSGHFEQIAFAQVLNNKEEYSSVGKKLTLYLISKSGQIFLLFPFVCPQILLDQNQQRSYIDLRESHKFKQGISSRGSNITNLLKMGKSIPIPSSQQLEQVRDNNLFSLTIQNPQELRVELFKLNPAAFYRNENSMKDHTCNSISAFKVLTLNRHTIFLHKQRLVNKQQELKVQILSQQPYEKLLTPSFSIRPDDFMLEIIGEFTFNSNKLSRNRQDDLIRLITENSMTNEIFLLHNNLTCYRLSFDGLFNLLASNNQQISNKLIDCDVIFKSNSQLLSIARNQSSIFFIRNQNDSYLFQSVPLQSIQLRQIIRTTIQQTETLFKKLANQPEPNPQTNGLKPPTLDFEKLNQATLINIQKKLSLFNNDSKKYIETKLQKIKKISEDIISKQTALEQQQRQKQQLIDLINRAEQNDKRIKEISSNNSRNLNKTQRDLERRIKAMSKTLDDLKQNFKKQNQTLEQDEDKRLAMTQCQEQADAVINRLEQTKFQLLEKRDQLRKSLAFA